MKRTVYYCPGSGSKFHRFQKCSESTSIDADCTSLAIPEDAPFIMDYLKGGNAFGSWGVCLRCWHDGEDKIPKGGVKR
jgi:hypothetical protein